MMDFAFSE
jgi:hypothetical protein